MHLKLHVHTVLMHMMKLQLLALLLVVNRPPSMHAHTHTQFWINDLNVGSNLKSNSNHIKSSCDFIAFNHDSSSKHTLGSHWQSPGQL